MISEAKDFKVDGLVPILFTVTLPSFSQCLLGDAALSAASGESPSVVAAWTISFMLGWRIALDGGSFLPWLLDLPLSRLEGQTTMNPGRFRPIKPWIIRAFRTWPEEPH